jgi:uncharacterized membrane protein
MDAKPLTAEQIEQIKSNPNYHFFMARLAEVKGNYPDPDDPDYIRQTNAIWRELIEDVNKHIEMKALTFSDRVSNWIFEIWGAPITWGHIITIFLALVVWAVLGRLLHYLFR